MSSQDAVTAAAIRRTKILRDQLVPSPSPVASIVPQTPQEARKEFEAIFPILAAEIQRELPEFEMPSKAKEWIKKLVNTTVPGGKMNRGLTVLDAFQQLVEHRQLSRSEVFKAQVLGWCVEWLQAFFLVSDDIMDQSQTRRGEPCWYRQPHPLGRGPEERVGNIAINDSFILEALIYRILQRHFGEEPYYVDLLNVFHDVSFRTELGQLLDLTSNLPGGRVDLSLFTLDTYKLIVKYKTAYYSFYLPVVLGMLLAGVRSKPAFQTAEDILVPMGEYFQIQDDFLDCYGDPKVIGKIGRDIEENKCGWLIVQALRHATPAQKKILEVNYGKDDAQCVAKVKAVYKEINIEKIFHDYEDESHAHLVKMIDGVRNMPKGVFTDLLQKIYKRKL